MHYMLTTHQRLESISLKALMWRSLCLSSHNEWITTVGTQGRLTPLQLKLNQQLICILMVPQCNSEHNRAKTEGLCISWTLLLLSHVDLVGGRRFLPPKSHSAIESPLMWRMLAVSLAVSMGRLITEDCQDKSLQLECSQPLLDYGLLAVVKMPSIYLLGFYLHTIKNVWAQLNRWHQRVNEENGCSSSFKKVCKIKSSPQVYVCWPGSTAVCCIHCDGELQEK
jgi:hypothetical protein